MGRTERLIVAMLHRRAKREDFEAIGNLALQSLERDPLPVTIDKAAMLETGLSLLNPAHFLWVTEVDGKVVAAFAACTQKSFWFSKLQCSVLLYYSVHPGAGVPLIREFARWVKSRSGIKVAVVELEPMTDPRLVRIFKRLGFARESINLTYVRGMP